MNKDSLVISALFPDLFGIARPVVAGNTPLIVSGSMLHIDNVQILPLVSGVEPRVDQKTGMKLYGALAGYAVLGRIYDSIPEDYYKLLWHPTKRVVAWIGSVDFQDSLGALFRALERTRFGCARVDSGHRHTNITLKEIIDLYKTRKLVSSVSASEIGSPRVTIRSDSSLHDALKVMFERRIRRLFSEDDPSMFVSGRSILRLLFSPERLESARKNPEGWLDGDISEIKPTKATLIDDDMNLSQFIKLVGDNLDDCLITDSASVVTRWDIVIKPWKMKRYNLEEG